MLQITLKPELTRIMLSKCSSLVTVYGPKSWQSDVETLWINLLKKTYCNSYTSLIAQLVKNPPAMQETLVRFMGRKIHWRRNRLLTPVFFGFPCGSAGEESTCNVGDLSSIPGLGGSPAEGNGYPLQYSGLENSMDCMAHGVTKSWTRLSNFHSLIHSLQHNICS